MHCHKSLETEATEDNDSQLAHNLESLHPGSCSTIWSDNEEKL